MLGGTGQVGFELVRYLAPSATVVAPSRAELDLTDLAAVARTIAAHHPSLIYNAAAFTQVDVAEREPVEAYRLNAELPGAIGEAAAQADAAVVHFSSDYVFNGMSDVPYVETDDAVPLNVYGVTKLAGEEALRASGAASLVFRTSWVYGSRGSNFALTVRDRLAKGQVLRVVDDQHGAPTWSRAIARTSIQCAEQLGRDLDRWRTEGGVYHVSSAGETTWYGFAAALADIFQPHDGRSAIHPVTSSEYRSAARRPRNSLLNSERVSRVFGVRLPEWREQLGQVFGKNA